MDQEILEILNKLLAGQEKLEKQISENKQITDELTELKLNIDFLENKIKQMEEEMNTLKQN